MLDYLGLLKMEKVMKNQLMDRETERGNVLFLILIAVALFAALSYAVTQSTRSGSGTADKEKSLLSGASMTQYPTSLRTSIIRMVLGGSDVTEIYFDTPAGFSGMSDLSKAIFHPTGGGAVYQQAPGDLMTSGSQGQWYFNARWDIPQIGIDGAGGNDLIAFLPGIGQNICRGINTEFSVPFVPACDSTDSVIPDLDPSTTESNIRYSFVEGDSFPLTDQQDIDNTGCAGIFAGQPSACFFDSDNDEYVFYSVLLER